MAQRMNDDSANEIARLADEYFASRKSDREKYNKWLIRAFVDYADSNGKRIEAVACKDVEAFIHELIGAGVRVERIATNFVFLRRFFDYLEMRGVMAANTARVVFARAGRNEPRRRTDEELATVFKRYHPRR